MADDAKEIASSMLGRLNDAWNSANGAAFAAEFSRDSELINIAGARIQGADAAATQMQHVFDVVFKGSHQALTDIELARFISDDLILVLSTDEVAIPTGPRAPGIRTRQTFLLTREQDVWRISHWHNTIIQNPVGR